MTDGYNASNATFCDTSNETLSLQCHGDDFSASDPYQKTSPLYIISQNLNIYVIPIIIFIGVIGNSLSFTVFVCTRLSQQSSSVYLASLAIVDSGFLLSLLLIWLSWVDVNLININGVCQSVVYVTYVCSFLSVWNVVCFTVERYIVVCYPFKRNIVCTAKKAKIVVIAFAVFAMAGYSFALWTSGIVTVNGRASVCFPMTKYTKLVNLFNSIDTVITLIIPSILILVLNIRIGVQMYRTGSTRRLLTSSTTSSVPSCPSQIKITRMLLVVSSVFLLLNLPTHAMRAHDFISGFIQNDRKVPMTKLRWQEILQIFYYSNFSINFFLYSFCGRNFRRGLCAVWKNPKMKILRHTSDRSRFETTMTHAQTQGQYIGLQLRRHIEPI